MNLVVKYLRHGASVAMFSLVLMAGFSASLNMLLTHDVTPIMETTDHSLDHGDHSYDFEMIGLASTDTHATSHKHIHNAVDHSHDTPVTMHRKPIEVFQKIAKLVVSTSSIPNTNMFYGLDRPPAAG